MVKKFTRRTLALVLCIVMLVSCWVFTSPTANAAATQAAGNYSVQLYIYVDDDDGKSWINGKDAQTATITVTYQSDNGYGSTTGTTVYDYSDDLYTCGSKIYKTLTVSDIPGFPTNVDITHDYGWADGCKYHLKTISICNTAVISNLNEELASGGVGNSLDSYSATIPANKYPSAQEGGSISASPTALTLDGTNNKTSTLTLNATGVKDQYGVNYASANCTVKVKTYSGGGTSSNETISGSTLTVKPGAHDATTTNTSNIVISATWKGYTDYAKTCSVSVTDEKLTIGFAYKTTNTADLANPVSDSKSKSVSYGDTISALPSGIDYSYYTDTHHWIGGTYSLFSTTTNWLQSTTLQLTYSKNGVAHSYGETSFTFANDGKTATASRTCSESGCSYSSTSSATVTSEVINAATCTVAGTTRYTATSPFGDGDTDTKDVQDIEALGHSWGEWEEITAPTCTTNGVDRKTCSVCSDTDTRDIPATGHDKYECTSDPGNGHDSTGAVYFACHNCENYWSASYDDSQQKYVEDEEYASAESAISNSEAVPAPEFNSYYNEALDYFYDERGASLKIAAPFEYSDSTTRQGLRFTSSLHIPGSEDIPESEVYGEIVDFGFVYSQTALIGENINNLYIGAPNVYKMSVVTNNAGKGAYDGTNWTGVSSHTDDYGGITLTFNLVLNVKAYNWVHPYCARSFVTYNYNGHQYTVYDSDYSSRSVEYIARAVIEHSYAETEKVVNYCQNKILTPIDEGWIVPPNN